jgi:hypothetical protein
VFKGLHNRLGENGEALTVLSLLEGPPFVGSRDDVSGRLSDVSERLRQMAGGNDTELVNMYSVYPGTGGALEFLALELVPLRQAIQRLNEINGRSGDVETVLSFLDAPDEAEDSDGPPSGAITRLRDAMRGLFNRAGENGQPLTVLSLLSQPADGHTPDA